MVPREISTVSCQTPIDFYLGSRVGDGLEINRHVDDREDPEHLFDATA
jgi:hypothetical protein